METVICSLVRESGHTFERREYVDPALGRAWNAVEIQPENDAIPVLITRTGERTYKVEYWRLETRNGSACVCHWAREHIGETSALIRAAIICDRLQKEVKSVAAGQRTAAHSRMSRIIGAYRQAIR